MVLAVKNLLEFTAADVMTRDVICVPREMPMRDVGRMLIEQRISGAPVVDGEQRCIGVISSADFVALAQKGAQLQHHEFAVGCPHCRGVSTEWQVFEVETLPLEAVTQFMTPDPVVVTPTTTIREMARRMIDAHIHRIIVVDEKKRPLGIVSSTDLLATLAYAEEP